jgi:hypothetical protein
MKDGETDDIGIFVSDRDMQMDDNDEVQIVG